MLYTSTHASTLFHVSNETIRNWAEEFSRHLSLTANPGKGRTRNFTDEDMKVLALISELKKQGANYPDIHAALDNNQRGDPPAMSVGEVQSIISGEQEKRLSLEIEFLKRELTTALAKVREAEETKLQNVRLTAQLESSKNQLSELQERIRHLQEAQDAERIESQKRIQELSKKVGETSGEAYVRGFKEGLVHNDKTSKTDPSP